MTYATIGSSNYTYQPWLNIKQLIEDSLSVRGVLIYNSFPDLSSSTFRGYPFIVIPDPGTSNDDPYLGDRAYGMTPEITGALYHDFEKLGDNKLRDLRQQFDQMFRNRTNQQTLRGYGMDNVTIEFDESPDDRVIIDQKNLKQIEFTVSFSMDVVI